ncbi:SGNH/GDSL hydrolase family protein [Dyadobacter luteus]|uniref:SGNH/GDSL hydrolase family protein n=1 Tax=Dyadobacter luteus TaxID=2259619 RepID=UPI001E5188BF|nr:SGNH/GDSL hydrolase family protein [Dyadobacter luteus]
MFSDQNKRSYPAGHTSRRDFLRTTGAVALSSTLLSSCSGLLDDIFPNRKNRDKTLAFIGDSLTIGAGGIRPYGNIVGLAFPDRPIVSDGIVGQVASSIAVRQGGRSLIISIEGNKLNGIQPVTITKLNDKFLSTISNNHEYSRTGKINGVSCTIRRFSGDRYTITPATVSVIDVPEDSEFLLDDGPRVRSATQILWYGRNNIGRGVESDIMPALEDSVAYINSPARYIILGILQGTNDNQGTSNYNLISGINTRLAEKYGKNFVVMTPPTDEEMAAIEYTPSAADRQDLERMNFPRGMRSDINNDDIHMNDKGYQIVANRVIAKIKELKY